MRIRHIWAMVSVTNASFWERSYQKHNYVAIADYIGKYRFIYLSKKPTYVQHDRPD